MEEANEAVHGVVEVKPSNAWRPDAAGIFFSLLLAMWGVVVAVLLKNGNTRLWQVFAAFVFFEGVNRTLDLYLRRRSEIVGGLTPAVYADFLNTSVSLVHSSIISLLVVGLMVKEAKVSGLPHMLSHDVLYNWTWPGAYTALAISCGYFTYDQLDMIRKHLYSPKAPHLLVHHAVLLTCFTPALQLDSCINYLILSLICEVHSIFLHLRKVKKLSSPENARSAGGDTVTWVLNWIAFFSARLFVHFWITGKLLWDASKFPRGFEWPLALTGMVGLNVLNVLLGQGLYKALMKERASSRRKD
ncbi:uncharacterized protein [Physcomitrium patens]|uniref:TLC domain-containing protein n=1 Tax=Physcomitrium patens TaxID=3218 RepID=A0A2K1JQH0_PHYPA|nr:TLC domain-containing protein 2-like [Physcomitrium patens]XP_024389891.1 TLC domain-containing protein 2-like [Physcomitrium patens]PNR43779.1 hypothetical protein PHYPA_016162 [Physcomitrium patens]|eukprot:XP_024389890.1 TLC domain-containing protein 2-like [Physcomitrella patens]